MVSHGENDAVQGKEIIGEWPGVDNKEQRTAEIKAKNTSAVDTSPHTAEKKIHHQTASVG